MRAQSFISTRRNFFQKLFDLVQTFTNKEISYLSLSLWTVDALGMNGETNHFLHVHRVGIEYWNLHSL